MTIAIDPADHLRLAGKLAGLYLRRHPRLEDDILGAAYLGLCLAACRYDGRTKFGTYAGYWVKREVVNYLRDTAHIRLPRPEDARRTASGRSAYEAARRVRVLDEQEYDMSDCPARP